MSRKLASIAAAVTVAWVAEAQAAPMLEPAFIAYHSDKDSGFSWKRTSGFFRFFVNWTQDSSQAPHWSAQNIQWVQKNMGKNGNIMPDPHPTDPETGDPLDPNLPPWRSVPIPEPGTAMVALGAMGFMALRRRQA